MKTSRVRKVALAVALLLIPSAAGAAVTVKGKLKGTESLINQAWDEAKDPKSHRYTFREPSPTVSPEVRRLTGHLPKELCVAILSDAGAADKVPVRMVLAGGRTTPVTLVVAPGQQIQFENHDPFKHRLYETTGKGGFTEGDLGETKSVTWTPPGPGKYEFRDRLVPSLRTWVVVEPRTLTVAYPNRKGEFAVSLEPGTYALRGYFEGEPVGEELPIEIKPAPAEQALTAPLVVGVEKKKAEKEDKDASKEGEK